MGTTLLHRSRGGVVLTEPGKLLYESARPLLRQFTTLKEQVGELAKGNVAIGLPPSWRSIVSVRIAETLLVEFPEIKVRINEAVSHSLRDQLAEGSLDLCIAPSDSNVGEAFKQTRLVRDPMVLVGGPDSELQDVGTVPLSKLDGLSMIIPSRPNIMRAKVEHELALMGLDLNVAIETDTLNLCLDLASRGAGYTVVPRCALLSLETTSTLHWAKISDLEIVWSLFENTRRSHSHAVRHCRREIGRIVQQKLAEGDWTDATGLRNL